jgi:hypothetical protein
MAATLPETETEIEAETGETRSETGTKAARIIVIVIGAGIRTGTAAEVAIDIALKIMIWKEARTCQRAHKYTSDMHCHFGRLSAQGRPLCGSACGHPTAVGFMAASGKAEVIAL